MLGVLPARSIESRVVIVLKFPRAQVLSVSFEGEEMPPGCVAKVTVRCPHCQTLHTHRIYAHDSVRPARTAPCSTDIWVGRYRIDLRAPVPPKRDVSQPHPVHTAGEFAGSREQRDDNAMHNHEPNWIE